MAGAAVRTTGPAAGTTAWKEAGHAITQEPVPEASSSPPQAAPQSSGAIAAPMTAAVDISTALSAAWPADTTVPRANTPPMNRAIHCLGTHSFMNCSKWGKEREKADKGN